MQLHLKLLANALQSALDKINSGACDEVPIGYANQARKSVEGFSNAVTGDDLVPIDEVCDIAKVCPTTIKNFVNRGDIPKPEPLDREKRRVGIRRKYIDSITKYKRS